MKYAIKVPIDDGGWLYVTETKEDGSCDIATYDTREEAEEHAKLWNNGTVVECQYTEAERLRAKKQAIKEELYDKVKMEMFKASSELEGFKTITDEEYELFRRLKKIWLHSVPEKSGLYFICGEAGEKDEVGLPESILVCPSYGSDGMAMYTKTKDYSAPGY